ncbi:MULTISPECIES: DUF488 domain-containing protein [unclassified Nocardia]|uniref:DUF488 domain-containing protein n=1 Tax=unclassified Nocardia TaxID=2637762 RepID=UPI001CE3ED38|nr:MULTISPECIES: DUF488 family protein [unclassified Nocardia]
MDAHIGYRRVYDPVAPSDGTRVLVDRVWPRGLRRGDERLGEWLRDIAPSTELRQWYGHRPDRFAEFERRYRDELTRPDRRDSVRRLRELAAAGPLTLVTATKDADHSQAAVLARWLKAQYRAAMP